MSRQYEEIVLSNGEVMWLRDGILHPRLSASPPQATPVPTQLSQGFPSSDIERDRTVNREWHVISGRIINANEGPDEFWWMDDWESRTWGSRTWEELTEGYLDERDLNPWADDDRGLD
jgi:hypothetical protein